MQIRTQRMEDIAERGFAAHWKYKHATISQDEDEFDQVAQADPSCAEQSGRRMPWTSWITSCYRCIPLKSWYLRRKGESRKMPYGATALDFAYDIHSKIGNSAISAKINHKLGAHHHTDQQRRSDRNHHGRQRPAQTRMAGSSRPRQKPNRRSKLPQTRASNNIEHGMQMLDEKMKSLNVKLSGRVLRKIVPISTATTRGAVLQDRRRNRIPDNPRQSPQSQLQKQNPSFWTLFIPKRRRRPTIRPWVRLPLLAADAPAEPQFEIAECCKPTPGDKVIGYRDPASGKIIVHKAT